MLSARPHLPVAFSFLLLASAAFGQTMDGGPAPADVRVRVGPLLMNPTVSVPNIGVDTNVFNEPRTSTPKRDVTLSLAPRADMWLRMGRTWLSGTVAENVVWYQKYASERSANHRLAVAWKAPLNRIVLSAGAEWLSTRARPGFEVDGRVKRTEPAYSASAEVRGFARTFIGVRGTRRKVSYADAVFRGADLEAELNRTMTGAAVTVRHELTPLTSVTVAAGRSAERFQASSRSSQSDEYWVSVNFDPAALLKGAAKIGYTRFKPESADLPGYRGATLDVSLAYLLLGNTKVIGLINRAIEFSYDHDSPYYLMTGGSLSVAQRLVGPFEISARAGAQRLEYTSRVGAPVVEPNRTDRLRSYGGGGGYLLSEELRLGFNVDKERRSSALSQREYEGLKYGLSLTHGL